MTQHWYPFYWGDYSSKTLHLTQGQHGAYLLLLRYIYTTEKPIPDKHRFSIARALLEQEQHDVDFVLSEFFTLEGGAWVNSRAIDVIEQTNAKYEKRVRAGTIGGKSKASNARAMLQQNPSNARAMLQQNPSNARAMLEQNPSNALVTTTTTTTKESKKPDSAKAALWGLCRNYLGERKMSVVGKWVKAHGEVKVYQSVLEAQKKQVADPVAYITRILEPLPFFERPENRMPSPAGG